MQKLVEAQQGCAIDTPDSVCSWADVVLLTVPGKLSRTLMYLSLMES